MQIITQRHDSNWTDAHRYIIWIMFLVNTYALLGGSGDGTCARDMIRNGLVPLPQESLYALNIRRLQTPLQEGSPYLPGIREIQQELLYLAVHVGQRAREIRVEATQDPSSHLQNRQIRASETQARCRTMSARWAHNFRPYWPRLPDNTFVDPTQLGILYHVRPPEFGVRFLVETRTETLTTTPVDTCLISCMFHICTYKHVCGPNAREPIYPRDLRVNI